MPHHSRYAAREQAHWLRPDAWCWMRPDAARFLKPGAKLADAFPGLAIKYNPNQPRVPAGNPDGGRWTDGEGDLGLFRIGEEKPERGVQFAQVGSKITDMDGLPYYANGGHHEMPKGIYEKWDLSPETRSVFNKSTTGSLPSGTRIESSDGTLRGHYWNEAHKGYNDAVAELSDRFMTENGLTPRTMSPEDAENLLREIRNSEDPRIRDFNRNIRTLRRIWRFGRGRE